MRRGDGAGGILGTTPPHQPQHLCFHLFYVFGFLPIFKTRISGCKGILTTTSVTSLIQS